MERERDNEKNGIKRGQEGNVQVRGRYGGKKKNELNKKEI